MGGEVESHLGRNVQQILSITLQLYRLYKLHEQQKLQEMAEVFRIENNEAKNWLGAMNEVGKSQIGILMDNDSVKAIATPEDYRNLYAFAVIQQDNDVLSETDRKFYKEASKDIRNEARQRHSVDLDEMLEDMGKEVNVRDLRNPEDVKRMNIIDELQSHDRLTATNFEEMEVKQKETMADINDPQPVSVYGPATERVLTKTSETEPSPGQEIGEALQQKVARSR